MSAPFSFLYRHTKSVAGASLLALGVGGAVAQNIPAAMAAARSQPVPLSGAELVASLTRIKGEQQPTSSGFGEGLDRMISQVSGHVPAAREGSSQVAAGSRVPEKSKPGADKSKPAPDKNKPGADKNKPAADQNKPGADKRKPAPDKNKPGADKKKDPAATQSDSRAIAQRLVAERGWGQDQMVCLDRLWGKDSGWRFDARHPATGAYGIPQAKPAEKMATAGGDWRTNPTTQINWGLGYIAAVYGTPCGALAHSQATNWY
ncbi:hypothetical protein [Austwickia sp. TVS 96-490-7B]|uniref:aggregation-promoting factor C-terminal-like domain-containing protein n=1 Tax=Austwickia sp. TVS 96-490-7B TaxID=2830843 RepID=UPI001C56A130|nr:hypothetical protein [Austwickia sp. TVS 96-490-7B]